MASTDIQNRAESGTEDSKLKAIVEGVINGESTKENVDKELSNGTESIIISKEKDEIVSQKDLQTDGELVNGGKYEERESVETEESIDVVGDNDDLVELEKEKEIKESDKTRIVQVLLEESRESPTPKAQLAEKLNDIFRKEENNTKMTNETTPDFTRTKYGAGLKMCGRRPLRGIVSPHPSSKRKASYNINDSPNKKKIKASSTSSEGSRWNYFSSPFQFWSYKENCSSINGQQVSPNDSMVVNVDDLSVINNTIDDSQFENDWPEGNKPFWKMCNIM